MNEDAKNGGVPYLRRPDVLDRRADAVLRHLTAAARKINALRSAVERADDGDKDPLREVLSAELSYLENDMDVEIPAPDETDRGGAEESEEDD
jgi:hypothetical protein